MPSQPLLPELQVLLVRRHDALGLLLQRGQAPPPLQETLVLRLPQLLGAQPRPLGPPRDRQHALILSIEQLYSVVFSVKSHLRELPGRPLRGPGVDVDLAGGRVHQLDVPLLGLELPARHLGRVEEVLEAVLLRDGLEIELAPVEAQLLVVWR